MSDPSTTPKTFDRKSVPSRIVAYIDGSVHTIPEVDYQTQIASQSL